MPFSIIPAVRKPVVLITGANGEIGHGLIERLASRPSHGIVTLDVARLDSAIASRVDREVTGSILDRSVLDRVLADAMGASGAARVKALALASLLLWAGAITAGRLMAYVE